MRLCLDSSRLECAVSVTEDAVVSINVGVSWARFWQPESAVQSRCDLLHRFPEQRVTRISNGTAELGIQESTAEDSVPVIGLCSVTRFVNGFLEATSKTAMRQIKVN